jgi:hypothetical protein
MINRILDVNNWKIEIKKILIKKINLTNIYTNSIQQM